MMPSFGKRGSEIVWSVVGALYRPALRGHRLAWCHPPSGTWACTWLLDRQERFGPLRRQISIERVNEQRQEAVVPHDQAQFNDTLPAKLLQRCLEGAPADAMVAEEFPAIVHHSSLIGSHGGQLFAISQGINDRVGHAGLTRGR